MTILVSDIEWAIRRMPPPEVWGDGDIDRMTRLLQARADALSDDKVVQVVADQRYRWKILWPDHMKVGAIKLARSVTGMSLKEAKDWVETRDWHPESVSDDRLDVIRKIHKSEAEGGIGITAEPIPRGSPGSSKPSGSWS